MRPRQSSRREFLCVGVASVACACGGCGGSAARKPILAAKPVGGRLHLSEAESAPVLQPGGSLVVQPLGVRDKIIVVNHDGTLAALSAVCTHMGCTVDYNQDTGRIRCPCHGSEFALDGSNTKGPAKRPLKRYVVALVKGQVVIAL